MVQHEGALTREDLVPEVDFAVDKAQLARGETAVLHWRADDAEETRLWASPIAPLTAEPLDWSRIGQMGEPVAASGEREIKGEETTAYYLVVRTARGIKGMRQTIEVAEQDDKRAPETWQPQPAFLTHMEDRPHVLRRQPASEPEWLVGQLKQQAAWAGAEVWSAAPPAIWCSVPTAGPPHVIYTDETLQYSYSVANATCITTGVSEHGTWTVIDPSKIAGTKIDGGFWGAGATPACAAAPSGTRVISGGTWTAARVVSWVDAANTTGQSTSSRVRVDVLSVPQFKGAATNQRKAAIRQAVKDIEKRLQSGCILNSTVLDQSVAAFKQGHMSRAAFGYRLMAEVLCLGNITFDCQDVSDANWGAGHWQEYTNSVVLEWSPKHTPYLEYVILHELTHKCGFNSELYKYGYTKNQIEQQAHTVSGACYP